MYLRDTNTYGFVWEIEERSRTQKRWVWDRNIKKYIYLWYLLWRIRKQILIRF
jgi:hypothetical protein